MTSFSSRPLSRFRSAINLVAACPWSYRSPTNWGRAENGHSDSWSKSRTSRLCRDQIGKASSRMNQLLPVQLRRPLIQMGRRVQRQHKNQADQERNRKLAGRPPTTKRMKATSLVSSRNSMPSIRAMFAE